MSDIYKADTALQSLKAIETGLNKGTYSSHSEEQLDGLMDAVREAYHTLQDLPYQLEGRTFSEILKDKNKDVTTKALESLALMSMKYCDDENIEEAKRQLKGLENRGLKHKDMRLYQEFAEAVETFSKKEITDYDADELYREYSSDLILRLGDLKYDQTYDQPEISVEEIELDLSSLIDEDETIKLDDSDFIETNEVYTNPTVIASNGSLSAQAYGSHKINKKEDGRGTDGADYFTAIDSLVNSGELGNVERAEKKISWTEQLAKKENEERKRRENSFYSQPITLDNPVIDDAVKHSDVVAAKRNYAKKAEKVILAAAGLFTAAAVGVVSLLGYNAMNQQNDVASLSYRGSTKMEAVYQTAKKVDTNIGTKTQKQPSASLELEKKIEPTPQIDKRVSNVIKPLPSVDYSTYKVQKNDTIVSKWHQYRNNGGEMSWQDFFRAVKRANTHKKNLDRIWVGEELKIPAVPNKSTGTGRWGFARFWR